MIIEEEAIKPLKNYLIKHLEPICAAEPAVLATYIIALLKNDKTKTELQELCVEQLEDFLKEETRPFVAQLFEVLNDLENKTGIFADTEHDLDQDADRDHKHARREPSDDDRRQRDEEEEFNNRRHHRADDHNHREERDPDYDDRDPKRSRRDGSESPSRDDDRRHRREREYDDRPRGGGRRYENFERKGPYNRDDNKNRGRFNNAVDRPPRPPGAKPRCRDYDERGFCMRGELCPFDHGVDRIIVDDVQGLQTLQRNFVPTPVPPVMPNMFPMQDQDSFGLNKRRKFFDKASDDVRRLTPGPGYKPPMGDNAPYDPDKPNFNAFKGRPGGPGPWSGPGGPGAPGGQPGGPRPDQGMGPDANTQDNGPEFKEGKPFRNFGPRGGDGDKGPGGRPRGPKFNTGNPATLLITNLPPELNSIERLNSHFKKFGTIVNIQVMLNANKANIQFSTRDEAHSALKSPEAVLGNRFIKVFWANRFQNQNDNYGRPGGPQQTHGGPDKPPREFTPKPQPPQPTGPPTQPPVPVHPVQTHPAAEALKAKKEKQEALKALLKKKEEIRNQQIKQQKAILEMLSKAKNMDPQEKSKLLARLNQLTESIKESMKKDSELLSKAAEAPKPAATTFKQTKEEKEKERLDKELDSITQNAPATGSPTATATATATTTTTTTATAKEGTDPTALQVLQNKLSTLKQQAASMGLLPNQQQQQRKPFPRRMVLDNRTTTLKVDNPPAAWLGDNTTARQHFQNFGEISNISVSPDQSNITVQFGNRRSAEIALKHGSKLGTQPLQVSWFEPPKTSGVSSAPHTPQQPPSDSADKKDDEGEFPENQGTPEDKGEEIVDIGEEVVDELAEVDAFAADDDDDRDRDNDERSWKR